jgi:branched-chain amino acid transport system permease protein
VKAGTYKLAAFVISAFFAGMVGGMVVYFTGSSIAPAYAFDPTFDVAVALMCFMGGAGTLSGPIIGALLLEPLQQYVILQAGSIGVGFDLLIFGTILLLVLLFLPEGIVPSLRRLWLKWRLAHPATTFTPDSDVRKEALLLESSQRGKR